jgi:hypothetical protein
MKKAKMMKVTKIFRYRIPAVCLLILWAALPLTGCSSKHGGMKDEKGQQKSKVKSSGTAPAADQAPLLPSFMGPRLEGENLARHKGEPGIVQIHWETQSEEENFGFNIMRGDSENGKFKQVNPRPILGAGTSSTKNSYTFYDRNVKVGDIFYYYIQTIDLHGKIGQYANVGTRKIVVTHQYIGDRDK